MGAKFEESFWETDFNGTLGFDHLCKRIREGQKVCRDVEDFLKKKAKAHLQFSKALRSLAKTADGKEEIGGLGLSWQEMKQQTDKTANSHETSATELNKIADDLSRFTDGIKQEAKQYEENVKDKQKQKRTAYSKLQELQRTYNEKCRDNVAADNQLETAQKFVTTAGKELEKLKNKAEKCREAMEKADAQYRQSVESLEETRVCWEKDMEYTCRVFQKQEENRICTLRDVLWKCTNIDSQLCVDWDTSCECVRSFLERCDVNEDNREFVQTNMTGSSRPVQIEYENYFGDRPKTRRSLRRSPRLQRKLPEIPQNGYKDDVYEYTGVYSLAK